MQLRDAFVSHGQQHVALEGAARLWLNQSSRQISHDAGPRGVERDGEIVGGDTETAPLVENRKQLVGGGAGIENERVPVAHEFGHAVGNTSVLGRGDEYGADHAHKDDRASIMNVGNSLRVRHFDTVIAELDQMIPDTTFTVRAV